MAERVIRVHILVEGQTEETFVNNVLQTPFSRHEIYLYPILIGTSGHKGGIGEYDRARRQVLKTLKADAAIFCTTMFDYYGMPDSWPGRKDATLKPLADRPTTIERALLTDVSATLGERFNRDRFIPYVQMHEFEALLFSDPCLLAKWLGRPDSEVQRIRNQFQSPEEINDSMQDAPSKRILRLNAQYSKTRMGALISEKIGLDVMRRQCPHFNGWIQKLEDLAHSR